jgi:SagB-type dehydrogenase family enzyme
VPQKMTPSGGSRNPYEAYVYVLDVEGMTPGIYHYSALEHSLGLVSSPPLPRPSEMLGWQKWTDDAAAVVFLVAHYSRTMWKYPHPMAYRAVLIEAGHIAQNIMIAATSHGLTANPTALFRDSMIESCLQLESVLQAVNYAVLLGRPASAKPDFGRFVPNRLARRSR